MTEPGWIDVAGGKLTTYRLMAEQTIDEVVACLNVKAAPCTTAIEPLLPDAESARFSAIVPPEVSREAVEHYCRNEWALRVDDVMVRRTGWQYYHDDGERIVSQVKQWINDGARTGGTPVSRGARP